MRSRAVAIAIVAAIGGGVVGAARAEPVLLPPTCADTACELARQYAADPKSAAIAQELFDATGDIAGVGDDQIMDGGYRGKIHLVPQLPIGKYRRHLAWVADAMADVDAFFAALFADQPAPSYRWKPIAFRFVRSPGKRTPSAFATEWSVTYNVDGSLMTSAASVRDTLVHEIFHDNDFAHDDWSAHALAADYAAIVKRCGTRVVCLDPYAPNGTKVRGGTYYAFQPNNGDGVHEYAAELAVRYVDEQAQMLHAGQLAKRAFKCGPAENARAWQALVDEFFAGRDLVPAC